MEVVNGVASDVRAIGKLIENRTANLETDILQALLKEDEVRANELIEQLTISELKKLYDAAILLFNLCRSKVSDR